MAARKPATGAKPANKPTTEAADGQATVPDNDQAPAADEGKVAGMVKCTLKRGGWLRQPGTDIVIRQDMPTELKDNSWLELQIAAGLIEKAK